MLNKSNSLSYIANVSLTVKSNFCCIFTLLLESGFLALGDVEDVTL